MQLISDIAYGHLFNARTPNIDRSRSAIWASWLLWRSAGAHSLIFTNEGKRTPPGLIVLAALLWATRRRRLVLSEFLPGTRTGFKGVLVTAAYRFLLPKTLVAAQVMTEWERDDYARRYRIPPARLHVIPFYYFDDRIVDDPPAWKPDGRDGYLSTGKNACDWETLVLAATSQDWPLTIVAKRAEAGRISAAATEARISVRHDVPRDEHDQILASAELLIVALKEKSVSAGHVRLMTAATFGTPVVLTSIKGVRGYEPLAAALVDPGDPTALRATVNELMSDELALAKRMQSVREFARRRPYTKYIEDLGEMLRTASS